MKEGPRGKGESDETTIAGFSSDVESSRSAVSTNYETAAKYRPQADDHSLEDSFGGGVTLKSDYPYSTIPYKSNLGDPLETPIEPRTEQPSTDGPAEADNAMLEVNESVDRFLGDVDTRIQYQREFQSIESRFQNVLSAIDAEASQFSFAKSNAQRRLGGRR